MPEWKKTFCAVCYHNCGLEIQTEGHRITKVRPDRDHPRTKGYVCRKGMKIAHYQDHKERLTHPLKREGDRFVKISWDQAISEIAEKLEQIMDKHGPRALAYMGGGGQGCHMEAGFGRTLLTALGSQYHYSALAQELTGLFWINGRAYGRQNLHLMPDLDRAENFLVMGWNGYVSNSGVNRARKRINEFAKDPDKQLIVIDPLLSETAIQANTHLQIRIGTAALFLKSMIAIILQEGWEDNAYISDHCHGFDRIAPWFKDFDVASALKVCGVNYDQVKEVARTYASSPTAMRTDLGLLMDRQSTMNSYLEMILMAVCGRIGTPGGNVFNGHLMPLGPHSDERDERTWRTVNTGIPAIMGYFPPNVIPEEILSQKDDRLRAMIVSGANPLRSYADTLAYEQAFKELDLLVTIEIAMTETARMAHYVLPAKSAFEKWDATFFNLTFPETYFQVRQPCCEVLGEPLEEGDIYTRLAEALGILPEIPETLFRAAYGDRKGFASELMKWISQDKKAARLLPFIAAKTLGKSMKSSHLAAVWGLLAMYPQHAADDLSRAGYEVTPFLGDTLFQGLLDHPEGILIGRLERDENLEKLRTPDKKIHLYIEEMAEWIREIEPDAEKAAMETGEFPLVLVAGRHFPYTANSIMRDPEWNDHKVLCTALMSKEDIQKFEVEDGKEIWVTTEASRVRIPVESSDMAAPGTVTIPHGFGLGYVGQDYGVNVNLLTKNTHRDRLAGTPLHRYVPCRVEACRE
ncbi:MAG: molybdopterin-dependent oxidoreductase [Deltaproteobacteria bacterium]|nr:molybdopterin-dependent oxidoreductase [Deltaproteobacteria bacterium]